jgi:hypothetical protein
MPMLSVRCLISLMNIRGFILYVCMHMSVQCGRGFESNILLISEW